MKAAGDFLPRSDIQVKIAQVQNVVVRRRSNMRWYKFVTDSAEGMFDAVDFHELVSAIDALRVCPDEVQAILRDRTSWIGTNIEQLCAAIDKCGSIISAYGDLVTSSVNEAFNNRL